MADTERQQSAVIFIMGVILLIIRLIGHMAMQENYYFKPAASHMSYPFSLISCLAMICNFRQPVLNAIPYMMLPSYFFSIFINDVRIFRNYHKYTPHQLLNQVTIHIPIAFISIWILINRRKLISKHAIGNAFAWGLLYFLVVDDKVNVAGVNGLKYVALVMTLAPLWAFVSIKYLGVGQDMKDPYTAPLLILKWK